MKVFIVLTLVALAHAEGGGYTYGAGGGGGGAGEIGGEDLGGAIIGGSLGGGSLGGSLGGGSLGGSLGGGSLGGSLGGGSLGGSLGGGSLGGSLGGGSLGGGSLGGGSLGGGSLGGGSLGGGSLGGGSLGGGSLGGGPSSVEYSKEFYSFNAPESEFDDGRHLGDLASSLKKNLRVIFIRAPEGNGLSEAALNLARSAVDSKTAIYVLTKQDDISELANKLQNLNSQNANKPEVHFVKYRTPEDAANAQHIIQQQYNNLPGVSQSHDGGVAPVLNFASKGPALSAEAPASGYIPPGRPAEAPASSYIPPASAGGGISAPSSAYLPIKKF